MSFYLNDIFFGLHKIETMIRKKNDKCFLRKLISCALLMFEAGSFSIDCYFYFSGCIIFSFLYDTASALIKSSFGCFKQGFLVDLISLFHPSLYIAIFILHPALYSHFLYNQLILRQRCNNFFFQF